MIWTHALRAAAFAAFVALGACAQQETASAPAPASSQSSEVYREEVVIETANGPVRVQAEIADTEEERNRGLMFRREMAPDHGMLFDFDPPEPASFWMRNTHLSLDLIFIGVDGRILNIAERATPYSDAPIPSAGMTRGVLELNAGRARALGIAPGDRVRHRIFPQ